MIKPDFIYGTAWKEELTEACVFMALKLGFRAIDSANQRKHYYEQGVGAALSRANIELGLQRRDLFLQSKFTFQRGQDHRLPYDPNSPLRQQVLQSFESSLKQLGTDYLDSLLLHGPSSGEGLADADWEVWQAMEDLCRMGRARYIGVSNVNIEQLRQLVLESSIKPRFVQNRCLIQMDWDREIRQFCREQGIDYQGFSLLSNNWNYLGGRIERPESRRVPQMLFDDSQSLHPVMRKIISETGKNVSQVIFRFAQQLGMIPLVGSRNEDHLRLDLDIKDFSLTPEQVALIENIQ